MITVLRPLKLIAFLLSCSLVLVPALAFAQSVDQLFEQGNAAQAAGDYAQAEEIWRRVIQLDPDYAVAHNNLGIVLYRQSRLYEAIEAYQRAIQLDPDYAVAYNNLGNALYGQSRLYEAIEAYQRAIQLDPDYAVAYNNLGYALQVRGNLAAAIAGSALTVVDLAAAIPNYQRAIALDPSLVTAQNNLQEAERLLARENNSQPIATDDRQFLPSPQEEPLLPVLRSTARIVARITEGNNIGAGFVIKRNGNTVWIVTNRHVVSDSGRRQPSDEIAVEFFSELSNEKRPRYSATIENITAPNDDLDLAVLRVTGVPDDIAPLELYSGRISRNTLIRIIGHPYTVDQPWNSSSGEVTAYSLTNDLLPVNAYAAAGNSGGPVIDAEQRVIGMMVSIRGRDDIAVDPNMDTPVLSNLPEATEGIGIAYRIEIILIQLRQWGLLN